MSVGGMIPQRPEVPLSLGDCYLVTESFLNKTVRIGQISEYLNRRHLPVSLPISTPEQLNRYAF